jgi:hypothetical protein
VNQELAVGSLPLDFFYTSGPIYKNISSIDLKRLRKISRKKWIEVKS